jgi:DNA-binding NarL/FixJ family response regulator
VQTAPGAGTRLLIRLPRWEATADQMLRGLRILLAGEPTTSLINYRDLLGAWGVQVVGTAEDSEALMTLAHTYRPDVILIDVDAPALAPSTTIASIKANLPECKIAVLTTDDNSQTVFAALRSGASGCLPKTLAPQQFLTQLIQIVRGLAPVPPAVATQIVAEFARKSIPDNANARAGLTPRQQEILGLVAQGLSYAEVGARLYLSERTVRYHMDQVRTHLDLAKSRGEA